MAILTKAWARSLIATSVFWVLIVVGIIVVEYLSPNPDYFWQWSLDPFQPPHFEPNLQRIAADLFGPLPVFWVAGWLIAWVKSRMPPL